MRFRVFFEEHTFVGESYEGCPYIVDNTGYETVPQIMARLLRGELVNPKPMVFDSESDDDTDLDDVADIPLIEDMTDLTDVADALAVMADKQRRELKHDALGIKSDDKSDDKSVE